MREIIPAGDRGSFAITDAMMDEHDAVTLAAFEALLLNEAAVRGLDLTWSRDFNSSAVIVSWRPAAGEAENDA